MSCLNLPRNRRLLHAISRISLLIPCLAIVVLGVACRSASNPPANQQSGKAHNNELSATSDADLVDQIEAFSTDVGELGEAALKQLQAYPRPELIERLSRLRDTSSQDEQDEFIQIDIAFVLCNLDQDYQANRDIIVSAFNQSPDTADLYESQIDRLIQRGDKELLQVLFAVVPESDGDLSESLADTFAEQMKTSTEAFLKQLGTQPRTTRSKVSDLINSATSGQDKLDIEASLKSFPKSSPLAGLAKEMLSDLSQTKTD